MQKVKDVSKVIGFANRAGRFSPSNERSEEKFRSVMRVVLERYRMTESDSIPVLSARRLELFRDHAKAAGYTVAVIRRGANR